MRQRRNFMRRLKKFFQKRPVITGLLLAVGFGCLFFVAACLDGIGAIDSIDIILPVFGTSLISFDAGYRIASQKKK